MMFRFLQYKNIHLIFIAGISIFYILPSCISFFVGVSREQTYLLLILSFISIFVYYFAYFLFKSHIFAQLFKSIPKINVSWSIFNSLILFIYFSVILYASFTAPQIALFAAVQGADISTISELREMFLRTRGGWEIILLYIYSICIVALMPMVIAEMYLSSNKYRHYVLIFFLISLALTLEKGRALVAFLPLAVIFYNEKSSKKAKQVFILLIMVIVAVSFLARGGISSNETGVVVENMDGVPDEYNMFKGDSQIEYLLNRVLYIPYSTAIDWLRYKDEMLHGEILGGSSIGVLAALYGVEKVNLERDVFEYQWGQNITGTGSANTVYYVDAYLNFGVLGVLFYTILLAAIFRICIVSNNKPLFACLAISAFFVCMHGLTPMLFSGGLGILLCFALFFKFKH